MTRDRPCFNIVVRVSLEAEGDRTRWPIAGSRTGEPVRKPDKNAWNWIYLEPGFLPARAASILLSWGEPRVVLHGCTVSKPSALAINKLVEKVRERERERIDTRRRTDDMCTLRLRILSIERTSTTAYHASVCHVLSNFICEATKNLASRRRRYVGTDKRKRRQRVNLDVCLALRMTYV